MVKLTIAPMQKKTWQKRIEKDLELYEAFQENSAKELKSQLDYIVEEDDFLVCYVWGAPNSGKSEIADSIAFGLKRRFENKKKKVILVATFSFEQTLWKVKELSESVTGENVIFVQDEISIMHGKGSRTARDNLNNILRMTRAQQWSYIFSCPVYVVNMDVLQFSLRTVGRDKKRRRNLVLLYDEEKSPLGYAWIPLIENSAWSEQKYRAKMENINHILRSGGHVKVRKELLEEWQGVNEYITPYEGQTANLRKAVLDQLVKYGVKKRDKDIFKAWLKGETQADIGPRFELQQTGVSEIIQKIKRKFLGYAFEDIYYAIKQKEDENWIQGGKNTPDPDLLNTTTKQVISVKCYADRKRTVTVPFTEIAQSELDFMQKGFQLELVFYNILWDKIFSVKVKGEEERFSFRRDS